MSSRHAAPPTAADLATPAIKQTTYTTGRGGSGNMATNLRSAPEYARAAQDTAAPPQRLGDDDAQTVTYTGRGGGGNVLRGGERAGSFTGAKKERGEVRDVLLGEKKAAAAAEQGEKEKEVVGGEKGRGKARTESGGSLVGKGKEFIEKLRGQQQGQQEKTGQRTAPQLEQVLEDWPVAPHLGQAGIRWVITVKQQEEEERQEETLGKLNRPGPAGCRRGAHEEAPTQPRRDNDMATNLKLYSHPESGNSYRVRLLAAFLSIHLDVVDVDLFKHDNRTPEFRAINPRGQVPVLVINGGLTLTDSAAIITYLAGHYSDAGDEGRGPSSWWSRDALEQAVIVDWLAFNACWIQSGVVVARRVLSFKVFGSLSPEALKEVQDKGRKSLEILDQALSKSDWLALDRPTIADLAVFPYVALAPMGDISLEPYPAVVAWISRIRALPRFIPILGLDDPLYCRHE
ncbi:hypothetical protein FH972_021031 [Carpinus fangiana]|uniref:Glutathione transferase n=1 Tax=Carpinus fangiana TaxID=176857 RepID=A0A5N6KN60_9ROSI|nr:hypothetical protein FH972_021031 [Carpinus fangiana]